MSRAAAHRTVADPWREEIADPVRCLALAQLELALSGWRGGLSWLLRRPDELALWCSAVTKRDRRPLTQRELGVERVIRLTEAEMVGAEEIQVDAERMGALEALASWRGRYDGLEVTRDRLASVLSGRDSVVR